MILLLNLAFFHLFYYLQTNKISYLCLWCNFMIFDGYISIPGQALVIFKKKEEALRVIRKLNDGCLMLPNQRYA